MTRQYLMQGGLVCQPVCIIHATLWSFEEIDGGDNGEVFTTCTIVISIPLNVNYTDKPLELGISNAVTYSLT